ncbi:hypothetical protein [Patiriisocius hiemis]|uniref:Uncharacterized protein n=1 Tax=Patiriisocius hiemis TaxID=3075604 RepID=A0ABU2YED4_9FLAO|nr:hypothetical protein [Constantimarinum sp. W242]MDT0556546.1 hypothetical protein [Constantimarinum sp. W242]
MKTIKLTYLLITGIVFISLTSCEKKEPPVQVLTANQANEIEEEFKNTRARVLNNALGFEDTRDFWFSLDSLKKYIDYVEHEANKQGKQDLGLRVYFAAYPPNSNYSQPGKATVFMVPTFREAPNALQKGLVPIQPENVNMKDVSIYNYGHGGIPPNDYE